MLIDNYGKNGDLKNIAIYAFYLAILTSSFDIFLVFKLNALTIRACQAFGLITIIFTFCIVCVNGSILKPHSFSYLLIWSLFILIFSFNSYDVGYNLSYFFWLLFNILIILTVVNLFRSQGDFIRLYKFYINSFFYVALFGLLEFLFGVFHIKFPLITQWWIPGVLPRINGFSYEPSYYATYLIIGWSMTACLFLYKSEIISYKKIKFMFYIETISLVLSSSRMGWLMIVIWYLQYPLKVLVQIFKNKLNKKNFKLASLFFIIMFFIIVMSIKNFNQISIFLQGTGLGNTASHSVIERNKQFYDTITVFKNNLLKGVGLGGVNLEVARLNGIITDRHSDITGMSVFAEVLAASGLIGFIFFAIYIFKLIQKPVNVIKTTDIDLQNKIIVKSLIISFIFELTILQFNQNILRIYLWIHISILSLNYYRVIRNYSKRDSNSRREINGK